MADRNTKIVRLDETAYVFLTRVRGEVQMKNPERPATFSDAVHALGGHQDSRGGPISSNYRVAPRHPPPAQYTDIFRLRLEPPHDEDKRRTRVPER